METRVDEIAEKIYRLSTFVPGTASGNVSSVLEALAQRQIDLQ
jgi:hypothetical protein